MVGPRRVAVEVDGDAQLGGRRAGRTRSASATQSSIVTPETGTNGQTSIAPTRGCSPFCVRMSIRRRADAGRGERALDHGLGLSDEGVDGAVRGRAGVDVEQRAAGASPGSRRRSRRSRPGRGPPRSSARTRRAFAWSLLLPATGRAHQGRSSRGMADSAADNALMRLRSPLVAPLVLAPPRPRRPSPTPARRRGVPAARRADPRRAVPRRAAARTSPTC